MFARTGPVKRWIPHDNPVILYITINTRCREPETMVPHAKPQHAVDAFGALADEIECRQCGYNLRGLMPMGLCSECGAPVAHSLRVDLLRYANPDWLREVSTGVRIIVWMILIGILGGIATIVAPELSIIIGLTMTAVGVYGSWLLTEQEPGGAGQARISRSRRLIRIAILLAVAGQLLSLPFEFGLVPELLVLPASITVVLLSLFSLVGEYFKFVLYEHLAARIPEPFLARRAKFLSVAFPITLAIIICYSLALPYMLVNRTQDQIEKIMMIIGCVGFPFIIMMCVFAFMTVSLLIRLNKALKQQADLARRSWTPTALPVDAQPESHA